MSHLMQIRMARVSPIRRAHVLLTTLTRRLPVIMEIALYQGLRRLQLAAPQGPPLTMAIVSTFNGSRQNILGRISSPEILCTHCQQTHHSLTQLRRAVLGPSATLNSD